MSTILYHKTQDNTRQKEMGSTNIKFITKEEIENIYLGESI